MPYREIMVHFVFFLFFNDTATTEIYTLSLHDALPILSCSSSQSALHQPRMPSNSSMRVDRKSTRLNSSHITISYAVFCLKKKKNHAKLCGASTCVFCCGSANSSL